MVTLITEQLQNQSLDEPAYHRAFSLNLPVPESQSPRICWPTYGLMPEGGCWQLYTSAKPPQQDELNLPAGLAPLDAPVPDGDVLRRLLVPSTSATDLSFAGVPPPPPPPPKRHCRSLSVPEDLSRCRTAWRPSASKIWTPVKRRSHSGGGAGGSCPLRAPSSSLTSSLRSSSSPTFFSLALSADSPLPWSFSGGGDCCCFFPCPPSSSCSSSPSPLRPPRPPQRRFSLSPVHIHEAAAHFLPPAPPPAPLYPSAPPLAAAPPSPSSACSTPCSSRRAVPPPLPRCHSQPCDMRKPVLKRRHAPDTLPCARPGLDFSKMSQTRSGDPLPRLDPASPACGGAVCGGLELASGDFRGTFSPADGLGRTSICPLSESEEDEEEEEEEEEGRRKKSEVEGPQQCLFERDCTELDLTLIEEN
ncbi:protein FAM53C-like [Anguilla rostrata]|uniref:protein FAM53C-like n=1 Tax=Anguilla rostrata TaxID=7938 RepID=UPI0030D30914